MSYNIDTWKTKKLDNFVMSLKEIQKLTDVEIMIKGDRVEITGTAESFEIISTIDGDDVHIKSIEYGGEGSGHYWDDFLECLKCTRGKLIANQVWEGGDSITKLTVIDGSVNVEDVDILAY